MFRRPEKSNPSMRFSLFLSCCSRSADPEIAPDIKRDPSVVILRGVPDEVTMTDDTRDSSVPEEDVMSKPLENI